MHLSSRLGMFGLLSNVLKEADKEALPVPMLHASNRPAAGRFFYYPRHHLIGQ
ncbi:hypothetical protein [Paenibacillus lautus]|uniref:hypothetical protein n=1 Tax=Paenibacillus lautus TaxID=1401 RepID=UPI0039859A1F